MTSDEEFTLRCYRAALEDVRTSELDQRILAAAHRRVAQRRVLSVSAGGIALIAIVLAVFQLIRVHSPSPDITRYGAIEGATRSFLLQVQAPAYAGPGMNEGRK